MKPPDDHTELRDFPWILVRLRCHFCQRKGDARLAVLSWHYGAGATLAQIVDIFMSRCPWDPHNPARKPQKYGMKCGAYCPDIGRTSPPDLPPLTLIEGWISAVCKNRKLGTMSPGSKPLDSRLLVAKVHRLLELLEVGGDPPAADRAGHECASDIRAVLEVPGQPSRQERYTSTVRFRPIATILMQCDLALDLTSGGSVTPGFHDGSQLHHRTGCPHDRRARTPDQVLLRYGAAAAI